MESVTRTKRARKGQAKIVVTGDVAVDWFEVAVPSRELSSTEGEYEFNWETYPRIHRFARPGGALLLANLMRSATRATVLSPELSDIDHVPHTEAIRSFASLDQYPYSAAQSGRMIYRVDELKGYTGDKKVSPLKIRNDDRQADLIVLDDASNGFRYRRSQAKWPKALQSQLSHPYVILKMSRPLLKGDLWEFLRNRAERLMVILTADDLRQEGVNISRRLSWERTAQDFVWQLANNPDLLFLNNCDNLIVRFGVDGVILCKRLGGQPESRVFFDPDMHEGGFGTQHPGSMAGLGNAFVAGLVSEMVGGRDIDRVNAGVRKGFCAMRRMWQLGLGENVDCLDYPFRDIFVKPEECDFKVASASIPEPSAGARFWCILEDVARSVEHMAYNYVINGSDPAVDLVPFGRFGNFQTLDRSEIESFGSIQNLIKGYVDLPDASRPLCIAVFGAPGSGKLFGITEVAKSVAPDKLASEPLVFNLSQYNSVDDLTTAFHKVRDVALTGKIPVVFFDEFDTEFNGRLGWLRYFLAPMEDGEFQDGEAMHPIGKSLFVFAGGTRGTFAEFTGGETEAFRNAKGTDFVSRLRGYVDIKPLNPSGEGDNLYMIRRAIILRVLLKKRARQIFHKEECLIDPGVLRAFIKVPGYKHGIRSMEAIIEMSALSGRKSYQQAALPPPEQLQLHVDAEEFSRLVMRDVLLGEAREKLAEVIHEKFREDNRSSRKPDDPAMAPWEELHKDFRESNRRQADDIPEKLKAIYCDFAPVHGREPRMIEITDEEYEKMAEIEHQSFVAERFAAGWTWGKERDVNRKTSPYLVSWSELEEKVKDFDRRAVRAIPALLAKAGFEMYRLR